MVGRCGAAGSQSERLNLSDLIIKKGKVNGKITTFEHFGLTSAPASRKRLSSPPSSTDLLRPSEAQSRCTCGDQSARSPLSSPHQSQSMSQPPSPEMNMRIADSAETTSNECLEIRKEKKKKKAEGGWEDRRQTRKTTPQS